MCSWNKAQQAKAAMNLRIQYDVTYFSVIFCFHKVTLKNDVSNDVVPYLSIFGEMFGCQQFDSASSKVNMLNQPQAWLLW